MPAYRDPGGIAVTDQAVRRGDVFLADLSPTVGSEQAGRRPVVILQNDVGNRYSPTVIVAPMTSRLQKPDLPTHVVIPASGGGLHRSSLFLGEHLRAIDKRRLGERIGHLPAGIMGEVDRALLVSLGLAPVSSKDRKAGR